MEKSVIPNHVAIIMDGNRRWAREKGVDYRLGHKEGAKTLEKIVRYSKKVRHKIYYSICFFYWKLEKKWRRSRCIDVTS